MNDANAIKISLRGGYHGHWATAKTLFIGPKTGIGADQETASRPSDRLT